MTGLTYGLNLVPTARLDDESESVLDDNILERSTPALVMDHRREGFSPRENWSEFAFPTEQMNATFFDQGTNPFVAQDIPQGVVYGNQPSVWREGDGGSCTPTTTYETYPSYHGLPVGTSAPFNPGAALSTSSQSGQDWSSISSTDQMDLRSMPKQEPLSSPTYTANPPLMRRDGIRKKNARFEIPAERTLRTIDHLINQTNDEQEIKELKQQKRLLRNRQAALDSRQRKKQHTERLEEEKKHTSTMISELEEALSELRIREDAWVHEREQLMMFHRQQKQCIDELIAEKEEIVRRHTIETGELRRKNAYLADQVQKIDSIAMSAGPSSTGYSADFSDFDHLTMESSPWDNFSMVTDFNIETEQKQDNSLVALPKKEKSAARENETTTASGLLLMLLLCGAWVTANNTSTASTSIPRMPEDVRVASNAVLETIYRDAGLTPQTLQSNQSQRSDMTPSSTAIQSPKTTLTSNEFASVSRSPLASFHQQLISPNEQQQRDQIFSLSAEQYNGLVGDDDMTGPKATSLNHRRNLKEALSALRSSKQGSAAEIYTRSLMWDEVPTNIVRDFARMMADARPASRDPLS